MGWLLEVRELLFQKISLVLSCASIFSIVFPLEEIPPLGSECQVRLGAGISLVSHGKPRAYKARKPWLLREVSK